MDYSLNLQNLEGEIWKDCLEYDGIYSVSNLGRVKSERRERINGGYIKESIRKQTVGANGEPTVVFSVDGVRATKRPMELVGMAFLRERLVNEEYCHKNKIKTDNRLSNIIVVTKSRSREISFETGAQQDWGIGERAKKRRDELLRHVDIYENGILSRKICTCCIRELDISEFYTRDGGDIYRNECKECKSKHDGVINFGKTKDRIELAKAGLRYCSGCKELKNLATDFNASKRSYLGKSNTCKDCTKINNYNFRIKNKG